MKIKIGTILKLLVLCVLFIGVFYFYTFADTVEIKNGVKTTYADKPRKIIDTINNYYDLKWALDRRGDWRLYIRKMNGKTIILSNLWVNIERIVADENGNPKDITDSYYFDYHEKMVTGWYVDPSGDMYFLNTDEKELGRMARGWCKIGDDYYFFNPNGVLLKNTITPDGFYVDVEGKWK